MLASANVVFSEAFNYSDGALTNAAPAVWLEHSSGTPLQVSGGQAQISSSLTEDIHAALTNQPYATGSGVALYASFNVKFTALPTAAGSYFAHYNTTSSHRCLVWASTANATGGFRLGIGNTTAATAASGQWASDLALNTTYFVVTRYNVGSGSSTLWLNPTNEADASLTATDATSAVSLSNLSLRQASGEGVLLLDNLIVGTNFAAVVFSGTNAPPPNMPPVFTIQPQSQTASAGDAVAFSVAVAGSTPFGFQWRSNNIIIPGATNDAFTLANVTTNLTGSTYFVTVTNSAGTTNSQTATLTVNLLTAKFVTNGRITLLTYNVAGNSTTDWSTNAPQVQAIGRELLYLQPDIITFNEIPYTNTWQMTNWVTAFMPGYSLALFSVTDGSIRSVIASRFPINRSQSWLAHADLNPFGYTNANFTRDLFEAEINVPNWPLPLHVFTTHLKSTSGTTYADASAKRAAEAAAITNFFATNFFVLYPTHPFTLSGDMNDGDTNALALQRLISAPTTLRLTNPTNPVSGSINTYSIRGSVSERIDFIFPSALLASNLSGGQVFRTDLLPNFPSNLFSNDDQIASDHLPVLLTFANPFNTPFQLLAVARTNQNLTLQWESQNHRTFNIEASSNLAAWTPFATNLFTTTTNSPFVFTTNNVADRIKFFRIYRVP